MNNDEVKIKAWGRFALFTKPETPTERVSQPVLTPPAARGVLGSIYAHPNMEWDIRYITALRPWWLDRQPSNPVTTLALTRNEVKTTPSFTKAFKNGKLEQCDVIKHRVQRTSIILCNVAYLICATAKMKSQIKGESPTKYAAILKRRVSKGQFYHKPYFGCREFACKVAPVTGNEEAWDNWNMDCGFMVHEIMWPNSQEVTLFPAKIQSGTLYCSSTQKGPNGQQAVKLIGS